MHVFKTPCVWRNAESLAVAVLCVEVKLWKSASRKMSVLSWSFAPIETLVDVSSPPDDPAPRAGQLFGIFCTSGASRSTSPRTSRGRS